MTSRGQSQGAPRDNVIFELGMFVGRLGRMRSILVEPRGDEVRLPSDLKGLTTITYRPAADKEPAKLGPVCTSLREIFNDLGPR
ncbi:putative nucleotide-binding protein containing TIR-like domain protein [compost metagenome]